MGKSELRKKAKSLRSSLDIENLSEQISHRILQMPEFIRAKNILLYHPLDNELNLLGLCSCDKNFYLPRVEDKNLKVCPYGCDILLEKSKFNIQEPCSKPVAAEILDFVIVPCLMADKHKFRLGYGGGYYDRFLKTLKPDCVKVSAIPSALLVEKLPVEEFDIPVDFVVSETEIF